MYTFSSPLTMELIFWQLEVDDGACAKYIGIQLLMIREGMDLFTKWYSSCDPACLVLALRRKLTCASDALVLVITLVHSLFFSLLNLLLHRCKGNSSGISENAAESNS